MAELRLPLQVQRCALPLFRRWETTSSVILGERVVEDGKTKLLLHGIFQCLEDRDEPIET